MTADEVLKLSIVSTLKRFKFSLNMRQYDDTTACQIFIGAAYFVSFVMFGTMIMLNLFIGVIINSMDEARAERDHEEQLEKRRLGIEPDIEDDINDINRQIEELQDSLQRLKVRVRNGED